MKTNQVTVKTLYEIELDFEDFKNAYIFYGSPAAELYRISFPKAYDGYDIKNHSDDYIKIVMKKMSVFRNGHFPAYITNYLKFDGFANAGHFVEATGNYRMTVFNYGDRISATK